MQKFLQQRSCCRNFCNTGLVAENFCNKCLVVVFLQKAPPLSLQHYPCCRKHYRCLCNITRVAEAPLAGRDRGHGEVGAACSTSTVNGGACCITTSRGAHNMSQARPHHRRTSPPACSSPRRAAPASQPSAPSTTSLPRPAQITASASWWRSGVGGERKRGRREGRRWRPASPVNEVGCACAGRWRAQGASVSRGGASHPLLHL